MQSPQVGNNPKIKAAEGKSPNLTYCYAVALFRSGRPLFNTTQNAKQGNQRHRREQQ